MWLNTCLKHHLKFVKPLRVVFSTLILVLKMWSNRVFCVLIHHLNVVKNTPLRIVFCTLSSMLGNAVVLKKFAYCIFSWYFLHTQRPVFDPPLPGDLYFIIQLGEFFWRLSSHLKLSRMSYILKSCSGSWWCPRIIRTANCKKELPVEPNHKLWLSAPLHSEIETNIIHQVRSVSFYALTQG